MNVKNDRFNTEMWKEKLRKPGVYYSSEEEEVQRLKALYRANLVDSGSEESLDRITRIIGQVFHVPICLISLITEDRQCFKSSVGLPEELQLARGTEREAAFCQYVVTDQQPMVVENPNVDPRFKDNLLVRDYHIEFYAGVPLRTKEGYILGSLCIIDLKPRTFSEKDLNLLTDFSHWVMTELELRQELQVRSKTEKELEELLEKNKWLITAIESTSTGVCITDPSQVDNPIIYVNSGFLNITGYSVEEVIGQNCRFLQGQQSDPIVTKKIREALQKREPITVELINYRKNGKEFYNELTINPVCDDHGVLTHFVGIQNDVSRRKRAEKKINDAYIEQQNVMETIPDIIYLLDLQGRLVKWNRQLNKYTGLTDKELQNKYATDLFPASEKKLIELGLNDVTTSDHVEIEAHLIGKEGKLIPFYWSAVVLKDTYDNPVGVTGVGKDITENILAQQDLLIASQIQKELLPSEINNGQIKIKSIYYPLQFVSGDFFDYFWIKEKEILFGYIVDIKGHGVAPAMQISALRVLFQQAAYLDLDLAEKIRWINRSSLPLFPEEYFSAAVCFEINVKTNRLTYVSAGMNCFIAYIRDQKGIVKVPGSFLGLFEDALYDEHVLEINAGDRFIFMSDGLYENISASDLLSDVSFDGQAIAIEKLILSQEIGDDCTAICIEIQQEES